MSSRAESLRPPVGGAQPRDSARLPDGSVCFLAPLAHEIAERHLEEFPDERERYGPAGFEWCVHDIQWILTWAVHELTFDEPVLERQLDWLGNLLAARGYPAERVTRAVELAAEAVERRHPGSGAPLAGVLRTAAERGAAAP
jgi:hypothetical protein